MGRIGILETPDTISNIVESVKKLLELDQVRVGFAKTHSPGNFCLEFRNLIKNSFNL